MARIVHLSDLHHQLDWRVRSWASTGWRGALGRFELHGLGRFARFAGVSERIRRLVDHALSLEPDHIFLTGDLSALGHPEELLAVKETLQPLADSGKLIVIPGNHDRYTDVPGGRTFERLFQGHLTTDWPEHCDASGYPFVRLQGDKLAIVGLDSTRVRGLSQYFIGRIGPEQLALLARILDDPRMVGRTILIAVHHGPWGSLGAFSWRESALLDGAALLALLYDRPVVLFHGHSHRRYWHQRSQGVPHQFGGGSSTEPGNEGLWQIELSDHLIVEARELPPLR